MLIGEAEPFARGRKRFIVGPSFANASDTTKLALSKPKLFSALATAEFKTFKMISAALFGVNVKIAIASAKAMARTVRVSPRKSRLVLDNIRGKSVADAIAILTFTPNKAARVVEKVLNSAIANAENNFGLEKANLVVSETFANEGPTMKRFRPRAKGSASPINKRTAHITVAVAEK